MIKERGGGAQGVDAPTLYLNVGLSTGVLIRVAVDPVVGQLSDSRQRFLGSKSIKLFRVMVHGQQGVLALTTRAWLMYNYQGRYFQAPVSYEALEYASNFSSEMCPEGIVAVAGNTLRIVTVDNLGAMFNQTAFPLRYTPRKMCRVPNTRQLVIVETDQHEYNEAERAALVASSSSSAPERKSGNSMGNTGEGEEEEEDEGTVMPVRGPLPPGDGKWASCIRVIEPSTGTSREVLELSNNEAAFSVCTCRFTNHSEETFVIVGTAKGLVLHPRQAQSCAIHVYRLIDGRLQLLHQTEVDDVPLAMCEFQGKLLVGVGRTLRLYELGKRKLLKKCENKCFPVAIIRILNNGDRIYVGDICDSVHFVKYKRQENVLSVFCDDTTPR
jgi:splicing factor 3B subunit 3